MTDTQLLGVVCLGVACGLAVWYIVLADRHWRLLDRLHEPAWKVTTRRLFPDGQPERDPADQHLLDLYFPHQKTPAAPGLKSERKRLNAVISIADRRRAR